MTTNNPVNNDGERHDNANGPIQCSDSIQCVGLMIDVDGALAWLGDDLDIYRSFLSAYMSDVSGTADQLQAYLEKGAYNDAARVMHTLKGLSATVGANELSKFAATIEGQLKKGLQMDGVGVLVAQTRFQIDRNLAALRDVMVKIDAEKPMQND